MKTGKLVFLLCILLLPALFCSACRGRKKNENRLTPKEGLETFIMALENGDAENAVQLVCEDGRENFSKVMKELDRNDIIATGLQFRQEAYALTEESDKMAIFWSENSKIYLVLMLEKSMWRVDPQRTDEMNAETSY